MSAPTRRRARAAGEGGGIAESIGRIIPVAISFGRVLALAGSALSG
jgi:hypothetical protein